LYNLTGDMALIDVPAMKGVRLKARSAVIFTDKSLDFAKALAAFFRQSFTQLGGKIIREEFFSSPQDFPGLTAKLKALAPQPGVIFIAGGPELSARAVKEIREAGVNTPIAGGDSFDSDALIREPGPGLARDLYFSSHRLRGETGPEVRAFLDAYRQEYGHPPEDAFAALGFDALGLIAAAIQRAGTADPGSLSRALTQLRDYQGVTGTISYRPFRAPAKPVAIIGVRQGRFHPLWSWQPGGKQQ
jgi:branched-chain amino acid transport system substrate-binding protein